MSIESIKTECEQLLTHHGLPIESLRDQIDVHFDKKKWICEKLDLNEGNDFRKVFGVEVTLDTRPDLKAFLQYLEFATDKEYVMKDTTFMAQGKNMVKISKVITEGWDAMIKHCETRLTKDLAYGRETFIKIYWKARDNGDIRHKFLCMFGDLAKNNRLITLSINPYDFLTSSGNPYCSFNTCIRIEGEYFNTVFDYFNSDCVATSYVSEEARPTYKVGRQLIYLNPSAFAQTRVFGAFTHNDIQLIKDYIIKQFGGSWGQRAEAPQSKDFNITRTPYIDMTGQYWRVTGEKHQPFKIEGGLCLNCSKPLLKETGKSGVCPPCLILLSPCCVCGVRGMANKHINLNGKNYCEKCHKAHTFVCDSCGGRTEKTQKHTSKAGKELCRACYDQLTIMCCGCSGKYEKEDMKLLNDNYFCKNCAKEYIICRDCSDVVHRHNAIYSNTNYTDGICIKCHAKRKRKRATQ